MLMGCITEAGAEMSLSNSPLGSSVPTTGANVVQCAVCCVQYAVCSVQCAVCSVQYAVCSMQGAVCSVYYTVCDVQIYKGMKLQCAKMICTKHSVRCAVCTVRSAVYTLLLCSVPCSENYGYLVSSDVEYSVQLLVCRI